MLIKTVRCIWLAHIILLGYFFAYTKMVRHWIVSGVNPNHIVFFSSLLIFTWLSVNQNNCEKVIRFIAQKKKILFGIIVIGIALLEGTLWYFAFEKYPTFSNLKTFFVNGKLSAGEGMYRSDDYFSYKVRENLNLTVTSIPHLYTSKIKTNSDGFRFFVEDETKPNIMFLGDSATFGIGTSNGETYPEYLGELLGKKYNILNYGVSGWGFAEYYLAYRKFVKKTNPQLVVMGVYPGNDYENLLRSQWADMKRTLPTPPLNRIDVYVDDVANIRGTYLKNQGFLYEIPVLREMKSFIFLGKRFIIPVIRDLKNHLLGRKYPLNTMHVRIISKIAGERPLLIVVLPSKFHFPNKEPINDIPYFGGVGKLKNVHILNLHPSLKENYKDIYVDGLHFNKKGNKIIARSVYQFVRKKKLLHGFGRGS